MTHRVCLRRKDALTLHNPTRMTQETQVRGCHLCHIIVPSMTAPESTPLLHAFDEQDKVVASAFAILQEAIVQRAFPAASVAVTHRGSLVAQKAFGRFIYNDAGAPSLSIAHFAGDRACPERSRRGGDFDLQSNKSAVGAPFFASFAKGGDFETHPSTLFDLASLTKVVATTTVSMLLYQRGLLDLDAPL